MVYHLKNQDHFFVYAPPNKLQKFKSKLVNFFIVLYPISPFQSINLMVLFALFLAIKIILAQTSIFISVFRTRISFAWTPIIIAGWFFGPLYGSVFGGISDILGFVISPGIWYWPYALQEITVGFFAGLVHSYYRLVTHKWKLWSHLIINQIFLFTFFLLLLTTISISIWSGQYLILGLVVFYFFVNEVIIIIWYQKKRQWLKIYLYAGIIVIGLIVLWSFLLGPTIAINYYKLIHGGQIPKTISDYGLSYYLIPRIIRETIKTPIQISLITILIYSLNPLFKNIYWSFVQNQRYLCPPSF